MANEVPTEASATSEPARKGKSRPTRRSAASVRESFAKNAEQAQDSQADEAPAHDTQEAATGVADVSSEQVTDADSATQQSGQWREDEGNDAASQQSGGRRRTRQSEQQPRKQRRWLRVLIVIVAVLLVAAIAVAATLSWNRWSRFDDALDFQGEWYPSGSMGQITVTADAISFGNDVSYDYTLDDHAKTIRYTLANLEGVGHYWFTDDRSTLVIFDGDEFDASQTMWEDLGRDASRFFSSLLGQASELPQGEGVTVLKREPDQAAIEAHEAAEKAAAEAEAAEQERLRKQQAEEAQAQQSAEWSGDEEPPRDELTNESPEVLERPKHGDAG